jgi:oligosaccharide repeat unit polymerase
MNSLDLALLFFVLLTVLNYRAQRSVLYPPFLFCAMWLLDLAVFRSGLIEVYPPHGNTLAIVAGGAASFSAGGWLACLAPRALLRIHLFPPEPRRHPRFLRNTLTIVLLCGLPVMFYQIYQLSKLQGGGFNVLAQARLEMIEEAQNRDPSQFELGQSFVLSYFTTIATFASLLFATERKDRQFWIVSVIALIACILSTGRTSILLLISGLSAIRLLQTKQESLFGALRLLRWPIAIFLALYVGLIFTNKDIDGGTGGVTGIATYFVLSYIVGPLAAFDKVVQNPADFAMTTSHTFEFPLKVAAALHLTDYTMPPWLDRFVFVPFGTNVYTVFKFYFLELGTVGTVVLLLFIGLLHSLLYLKARQGGRFSLYLFAYSMFTVLMVIFDDHYYETGVYLRVFAFGLLYFLIGSVPLRLFPKVKLEDQPQQSSSS